MALVDDMLCPITPPVITPTLPTAAPQSAEQLTMEELCALASGIDIDPGEPVTPQPAEWIVYATCQPSHPVISPWPRTPDEYPNKDAMEEAGVTSDKVIIWSEHRYPHYLVFNSHDHFASWEDKQPVSERCYHETILTDERHMLIDIDGADLPESKRAEVTEVFVQAFKDVMFVESGQIDTDLAIIDSSGPSAAKNINKYSIHIRSVDVSATAAYCHYMAQCIANAVKYTHPGYEKYVDLGIYKSTQNIRCVGSTKPNDARHSRIANPQNIGLNQTWLSGPAKYHVGPISAPEPAAEDPEFDITKITDEGLRRVLDAATKDGCIEGYKPRPRQNGNWFEFNKIRGITPPPCSICKEVHHTDNALIITIQGNTIMRGCRQDKTKTWLPIGELGAGDVEIVKKTPPRTVGQRMEGLLKARLRPYREAVKYSPEGREYASEKMLDYPFELVMGADGKRWSTLVVKAAKGVGKTEALRRWVDQHHENSTIIALTHRETFAGELSRQFNGFTHYKTIEDKAISLAKYSRLIIQMESLHKLNFEGQQGEILLILDESESIHRQLSSKLFKHFDQAFENFCTLINEANHVIALDAHISHMTLNLLADRYGPKKLIHNTFVPPGIKYKLTPDKDAWYAKLKDCLEAGKKIVVPTNSATEAATIANWLGKEYPLMTVKLYTGATDRGAKMADIENISEAWKVDVLIYSPTITAGVSFKEKWFDMVFGFFRVGSSPAAECDQMLGRVRDLADKEGVLFIDMSSLEGRLTREQIRDQVMNSRAIACSREWNRANLTFINKRAGDEWTKEVKDQRYFDIWLSNELTTNHSRAAFAREMICLLQQTGCGLEILQVPAVDAPMEEIGAAKEQVMEAKHQATVNAPEVDHEGDEYEKLRDKVDKTPEDDARLHADWLTRVYGVKKEDITVDWCKRYDNPRTIDRYQALDSVAGCREHRGETTDMLADPAQLYLSRLNARKVIDEANWTQFGGRPSDLDRAFHFEKHRIAHEFLMACGYNTLHDTSIIQKGQLEANILAKAEYFNSTFDHVKATFRTRGGKPNFHVGNIGPILRYINSVLTSQYDIKIAAQSRANRERNNFMIFRSDLYQMAMKRPEPPAVVNE